MVRIECFGVRFLSVTAFLQFGFYVKNVVLMPHFVFPFLDVGGYFGVNLLAGLAAGVITPFGKFFVNRPTVVKLFAESAFEE